MQKQNIVTHKVYDMIGQEVMKSGGDKFAHYAISTILAQMPDSRLQNDTLRYNQQSLFALQTGIKKELEDKGLLEKHNKEVDIIFDNIRLELIKLDGIVYIEKLDGGDLLADQIGISMGIIMRALNNLQNERRTIK